MKRSPTTYSRREIVSYLAGTATLGARPWLMSREGARVATGAPCDEQLLKYLQEVVLRTPESVDALLLGPHGTSHAGTILNWDMFLRTGGCVTAWVGPSVRIPTDLTEPG